MQKYLLSILATQGSLFCYKNLHYVLLTFTSLCFLLSRPISSDPLIGGFSSHYNSHSGALLEEEYSASKHKPKITHNFYQLMNLRKALSPRYIQVLNQRQYALTGKIVQKGILFSYGGPLSSSIRKVSLAGSFNNWSEIPMQRNHMGIFFHILPVKAGSKQAHNSYRYKFVVDGSWQHDPNNPYQASDQMGAYYSIFYLDEGPINRLASVRVRKSNRKSTAYWVEFSVYLPKVRNLTLVGNFNNWNPEHDPMAAQGNGMFRRKIKLEAGEYIYKFIADGKWVLDIYNPETRFDPNIQELASFLKVPTVASKATK